ncbi:MAG: hypothetical protein WBR29_12925 [Gammaproteobacteria bacterium]
MRTNSQRGMIPGIAAILLFAAITVSASSSPFVGSIKTKHAILYLNVDQRARQIWPVEIRAVDGVLSNRANQGVLWIQPGIYTFTLRVSQSVNLADVPGLARSANYGHTEHELYLRVQTGKAYYIGARFEAAGTWKPVVWKVHDTSPE